jgi:hypothetical protein
MTGSRRTRANDAAASAGANGIAVATGIGQEKSVPATRSAPRIVGFTISELVQLHAAYRRSSRGVVFIAVRQGQRILTLAIPPARSEEALYRQMRQVARRLRAAHGDGWLLARRASARLPRESDTSRQPLATESETVLLVQEYIKLPTGERRHNRGVSLLRNGDVPTFYAYAGNAGAEDRVTAVLIDACG